MDFTHIDEILASIEKRLGSAHPDSPELGAMLFEIVGIQRRMLRFIQPKPGAEAADGESAEQMTTSPARRREGA